MASSQIENSRAWTQALALLTGCYVTLVGAVRQVSPEEILFRAVVASIVVLFLTRFALSAIQGLTRGNR